MGLLQDLQNVLGMQQQNAPPDPLHPYGGRPLNYTPGLAEQQQWLAQKPGINPVTGRNTINYSPQAAYTPKYQDENYVYGRPGQNYNQQTRHYSDVGKQLGHPAYSNQAESANPATAPYWKGEERYVPNQPQIQEQDLKQMQRLMAPGAGQGLHEPLFFSESKSNSGSAGGFNTLNANQQSIPQLLGQQNWGDIANKMLYAPQTSQSSAGSQPTNTLSHQQNQAVRAVVDPLLFASGLFPGMAAQGAVGGLLPEQKLAIANGRTLPRILNPQEQQVYQAQQRWAQVPSPPPLTDFQRMVKAKSAENGPTVFPNGISRQTTSPKLTDDAIARLLSRHEASLPPGITPTDFAQGQIKNAGQSDYLFDTIGRGMTAMPVPLNVQANLNPFGYEKLQTANNALSARYPRISSQVKGINVVDDWKDSPNLAATTDSKAVYDPNTQQITFRAKDINSESHSDILSTLAHELTHHVQSLKPGLAARFKGVPTFSMNPTTAAVEPAAYYQGFRFGGLADKAIKEFGNIRKSIPSRPLSDAALDAGTLPSGELSPDALAQINKYFLQKQIERGAYQ